MVAAFSRCRIHKASRAFFLLFLSISVIIAIPISLERGVRATNTSVGPQNTDTFGEMGAAIASLQSGQGPLDNGRLSCSAGGIGGEYCETAQIGQASSASIVSSPWTNITSGGGPSPRSYASIAYDAADGYVVLFGGST